MTLANVTAVLQIGAWMPSGSQNADFWSGTLDEVRVYGRGSTAAEIQTDMLADPEWMTAGIGRGTSPARPGAVRPRGGVAGAAERRG